MSFRRDAAKLERRNLQFLPQLSQTILVCRQWTEKSDCGSHSEEKICTVSCPSRRVDGRVSRQTAKAQMVR
jgi:hypothetical protein